MTCDFLVGVGVGVVTLLGYFVVVDVICNCFVSWGVTCGCYMPGLLVYLFSFLSQPLTSEARKKSDIEGKEFQGALQTIVKTGLVSK